MSASTQRPDDEWVEWNDSDDDIERPRTFKGRFTARPNKGTWIGIIAMVTFLVGTALPWYSVSAEVQPWIERTTIIEFDGVRGLTVDPRLREVFEFSLPSVLFPLTAVAAIAFLFRLRGLFKAPHPGKRAGTFIRSTIGILLPIGVAVFIISQVPNFVPPDAPGEIHQLAQAVGSRPFGGTTQLDVNVTSTGGPFTGAATVNMQWGFGPALYVMLGAVVLYIIAAVIELGAARRLREQGT